MKIKLGSGLSFNITLSRPNLGRNGLDRWLSIVLMVFILGLLVTIGYLITRPNGIEKYTEFYLLDINDQTTDYPTNFTLENGQVVSVEYGNLSTSVAEQWGRLTLVIVNYQGQNTTYSVTMQIDGMQMVIPFQGEVVNQIGPISLAPGGKWEQEIGIVPEHTGNNQEVEIFLYKDGVTEPYLNLSLWINVD